MGNEPTDEKITISKAVWCVCFWLEDKLGNGPWSSIMDFIMFGDFKGSNA